jgi:hypothetical protein
VGLNLRFDPGEPVYTSRQICRWVPKIVPSVLLSYVTNRGHGTRPVPFYRGANLRSGLAGTIFLQRLAQTFRNLVAFFG